MKDIFSDFAKKHFVIERHLVGRWTQTKDICDGFLTWCIIEKVYHKIKTKNKHQVFMAN